MKKSLMRVPFIIHADLESLLEKMDTCHNNLESHQQLKQINMHSLVIHCLHTVHLIQPKISLIIIEGKII